MTARHLRLPLAGLALLPLSALASMGHIASNFGVLPQDVASAQALSMFSNQPSAVYYNPAYLAKDRKGALTAGFLYTSQDLTAKDWDTPDDVVVDDVIEDSSNYNILLGTKTDLSQMLKSKRPLVLGMMLGAERTGNRLMSFSSTTSQTAQSLRYGQQSLFLSLGAGLNVVPGFDVGASTRITLAASADLSTYTDLSGNTLYENISVSAKPDIQPVLSGNIDWGQLACPQRGGCWATGLETALSWRYESAFKTDAHALAVVPNVLQGLPLTLVTIDSYQPETWAAAMQYNMYKLRLAAGVDYQLWSGLNDKLETDTVKQESGLKFKDVLVPRVGFEYRVDKTFSIIGGVSYEESPLESDQSIDVNYVDNDRVVMGLGLSWLIEQPMLLSQPLRIDLGYQYHLLKDRDFRLASTRNAAAGECNGETDSHGNPLRCEDVTSGGSVQAVNASINLQF